MVSKRSRTWFLAKWPFVWVFICCYFMNPIFTLKIFIDINLRHLILFYYMIYLGYIWYSYFEQYSFYYPHLIVEFQYISSYSICSISINQQYYSLSSISYKVFAPFESQISLCHSSFKIWSFFMSFIIEFLLQLNHDNEILNAILSFSHEIVWYPPQWSS
jgi:hypothetical protein